MEKIYNKLQETKQNILKKILEKQDKERLLKIKNIHEKENINRLSKEFYHQGDIELFYNHNSSQAELLYSVAIDSALDDIIMTAKEYLNNHKMDQALELLNSLIDLNYTRAKYELGDFYLFNDTYKDIEKGLYFHKEAIHEKYILSNGSLGIYYLLNNDNEQGYQYINTLINDNPSVFMIDLLEKAYMFHMNPLIEKIQDKMNIKKDTTFLPEIIDYCFFYNYDPKQYIKRIINDQNIYQIISLIDIYLKHLKLQEALHLSDKIDTIYNDLIIEKYLKNGYLDQAITYTIDTIDNDDTSILSNIVGFFLNTKDDPLLDYFPKKKIIEILDRYEQYILKEEPENVDILISLYLDNYLNDKANSLFNKTLKDKKYRYTVSLLKTCFLYNELDKANLVYNKILANNYYSEMIQLIDFYYNLNICDNIDLLKNTILKANDKYYPAKLVSIYFKHHNNQEAYAMTKEVLKSFQYCYNEVYDYSFIYTLINSYLENNRANEIHDISLYVLKTTQNKYKLQRLYFLQGFEEEFKDILKEL